jgi:hypothetical protein
LDRTFLLGSCAHELIEPACPPLGIVDDSDEFYQELTEMGKGFSIDIFPGRESLSSQSLGMFKLKIAG